MGGTHQRMTHASIASVLFSVTCTGSVACVYAFLNLGPDSFDLQLPNNHQTRNLDISLHLGPANSDLHCPSDNRQTPEGPVHTSVQGSVPLHVSTLDRSPMLSKFSSLMCYMSSTHEISEFLNNDASSIQCLLSCRIEFHFWVIGPFGLLAVPALQYGFGLGDEALRLGCHRPEVFDGTSWNML